MAQPDGWTCGRWKPWKASGERATENGAYQLQVTQLHLAVPALLAELSRCREFR